MERILKSQLFSVVLGVIAIYFTGYLMCGIDGIPIGMLQHRIENSMLFGIAFAVIGLICFYVERDLARFILYMLEKQNDEI